MNPFGPIIRYLKFVAQLMLGRIDDFTIFRRAVYYEQIHSESKNNLLYNSRDLVTKFSYEMLEKLNFLGGV